MVKTIKLIIIFIVFALLQACAAGGFLPGVKNNFYKSKDAAYVTVMRESAFAGGGAKHSIFLDGKKIISVSNGTAYTFPVSPGKHFVKYDKFLETLIAKPSQRYFFIFKLDLFGERSPAYFDPMTYEAGLKEFTKGDYIKVTPETKVSDE